MKVALIKYPIISVLCLVGMLYTSPLKAEIDWSKFMQNQDLTWEKLPAAWDEAPFMGNGTMGSYICLEPGKNALRVDVGQSFVHDYCADDPSIYGRCRLLIGYFTLQPTGKILSGNMRLNLWDAETTATITTTKGEIKLRAFVASGNQCILVETTCSEEERDFIWEFHPAKADSPRQLNALRNNKLKQIKPDYVSNPEPVLSRSNKNNYCYQPLTAGGSTTTAWNEKRKGNKRLLTVTVAHSHPEDVSRAEAEKELKRIDEKGFNQILSEHLHWWHTYYPCSFISLPDKKLENFYWIQMYKLACATRSDGALIDNCGPWLVPTPWPNAWWNLNVELTYWSVYASNRLSLGESLVKAVHDNLPNLINNVPEKYRYNSAGIAVATGFDLKGEINEPGGKEKAQVGLLPWVCHNLWLQYRYSMDESILRETIYPTLQRAINYYLHFLTEDSNGILHLPKTYSPEYDSTEDCNFDLSLLRWGCETLLKSAELLKIDDPLIPTWQHVLDRLTDYPQDENGLLIGKDMPYAFSHRHYSHLLMLYPLYLINNEQEGAKELAEKSVKHWFSMPQKLQGYSFTGASSIASAFGNGDEALEKLQKLFSKFLRPNTMYKEGGPVIETPLSGAQCIHDMLLQSWGNKIRIFPAVPSTWKDIAFDNLRTEGAFLVSAIRKDGETAYIKIQSLAGEPCILQTDMKAPVVKDSSKAFRQIAANTYSIDIKKGETIILTNQEDRKDWEMKPIEGKGNNYFGLKQ